MNSYERRERDFMQQNKENGIEGKKFEQMNEEELQKISGGESANIFESIKQSVCDILADFMKK